MKYFKFVLYAIEVLIIVFSITEILSYLKSPDDFNIGTESMISNGGFKYKTGSIFLTYYCVQIILSSMVIFILSKYRITSLYYLALFLFVLQLMVFFL